ncbi:MAG: (2Fe-2S)-binding protein [Armatimonadetes bacterium]|nr:(2Fe-2S)-binding protein [Armatimonadota bacterium]
MCRDVTFAEIVESGAKNVDDAQRKLGVALKCGSCVRYIQEAITTGQTEFALDHEFSESEADSNEKANAL